MKASELVVLDRASKVYPPGLRLLGAARGLGRGALSAALSEVELAVGPGEVVGLVGPNGAGKSTLLRLVAGVVSPSSGTVTLGGRPAVRRRTAVGWASQDHRAFSLRLSARENLRFFAGLQGWRGSAADRAVRQALAEVGLEGIADRPYRMFSTGMKQWLAIAGALLPNARVLLIDEAASGLDPGAQRRFRTLLAERASQGACVLYASHDLSALEGVCTRFVALKAGRVVVDGSFEAVAETMNELFD